MVILTADLISDLITRVEGEAGVQGNISYPQAYAHINQAAAEYYMLKFSDAEKKYGPGSRVYQGSPMLAMDEEIFLSPGVKYGTLVGTLSGTPLDLPLTKNGIDTIFNISDVTGDQTPIRVAAQENVPFQSKRSIPNTWLDKVAVRTGPSNLTFYGCSGMTHTWVRYYALNIDPNPDFSSQLCIPYPLGIEAMGWVMDKAVERLLKQEYGIGHEGFNDNIPNESPAKKIPALTPK